MVLGVFTRRWRGKYDEPGIWRIRALAVIAVAVALPAGTKLEQLVRMLPYEILELRMPLPAWRWVVRWLETRRRIEKSASDAEPWLACTGSRGMPRQISYAATRTFDRAGLPGWRVSKLLRASWGMWPPRESFASVAARLVSWTSPLRELYGRSRAATVSNFAAES
jgi:hypothetical protein